MVELTKSGICYDIPNSPYYFEWRGMVYYFSSPAHREKFIKDVTVKERWLQDSFQRRFKLEFDINILADLQWYRQIETRGFYVYDIKNDERYYESWQIKFHGIVDNSNVCEMQSQNTTELLLG